MAALVVLGTTLVAAAAQADIVYDRGASAAGLPDQIVVAHDDGSSAQTIVTSFPNAGSVQAPGVDTIDAPAVSPSGKTIVFEARWDQANHEESRWVPTAPAYCGIWCFGVFKYENGTLTRVSHDPSPCPLAPCAVFESNPEITAGGQIVAAYRAADTTQACSFSCYGWLSSHSFVGVDHPPRQIDAASGHGFFDPQPASDVPTACSGGNLNDPSSAPDYPSPSPDGTKLVYTNCTVNSTAHTIVEQNMDGSGANSCGSDDEPVRDASFSLDGSRIVDAETGDSPGLWDYPSSCPLTSTQFVHALAAPSGTAFNSPRYTANGKILFVAVADPNHGGEVWSIPATCGQNGTPCNFPADATQITHTNNDVANVAWTSQTLVTPQSPANNTGNTSNSGSYTNNNNSPTPNSPTPTPTTHCVVPNLRGKTLRTAKKAPSRAHCKLGKVRKKRAARRYRGKVISQSPRRGTVKPAGAKVSVVVGR